MKDLLTGEEFEPKKISQKFATPENRIKYNNKRASLFNRSRNIKLKPINENHKILTSIMGNENRKIVNAHFLEGRGYNFAAMTTNVFIDKIVIPCIHEFAIIIKEGDDNIIIQKI